MQILNGLKQPGNALARGFCGLLFGYLIGVNLFGGLMDYYFSAIGADRPNILRTFAVVTAFLCGYGCWWYRWRKSPWSEGERVRNFGGGDLRSSPLVVPE